MATPIMELHKTSSTKSCAFCSAEDEKDDRFQQCCSCFNSAHIGACSGLTRTTRNPWKCLRCQEIDKMCLELNKTKDAVPKSVLQRKEKQIEEMQKVLEETEEQLNKEKEEKVRSLAEKSKQVEELLDSLQNTRSENANLKAELVDKEDGDQENDPPASSANDLGNTLITLSRNTLLMQESTLKALRDTTTQRINIIPEKQIPVPTFSGKYSDWPNYVQRFVSTTEDLKIPPQRNKERLLEGCTDTALTLIRDYEHLPPEDFVETALMRLATFYADPDKIYDECVKGITDCAEARGTDSKLITLSLKIETFIINMNLMEHSSKFDHRHVINFAVAKLPRFIQSKWIQHTKTPKTPIFASMSTSNPSARLREISRMHRQLTLFTINDLHKFIQPYVTVAIHSNSIETIDLTAPEKSSKSKNYRSKDKWVNMQVKDENKPSYFNNNERKKYSFCFVCRSKEHTAGKCEKFIKMTFQDRKKLVHKHSICPGCLKSSSHGLEVCNTAQSCPVKECNSKHHELMHPPPRNKQPRGSFDKNKSKNNPRSENKEKRVYQISEKHVEAQAEPERTECEEKHEQTETGNERKVFLNYNVQPKTEEKRVLLNVSDLSQESEDTNINFKFIPVTVMNPANDRLKKPIFALIDEGSEVSLIDKDVAKELQLTGTPDPITIVGTQGSKSVNSDSQNVSILIKGINEQKRFVMSNINTVSDMELPVQSLKRGEIENLDHLADLPVADYHNVKPSMLIGLPHCHLTATIRAHRGKTQNDPIIAQTNLGYVLYGPSRPKKKFVMTQHTSKTAEKQNTDQNKEQKTENAAKEDVYTGAREEINILNNMMYTYFEAENLHVLPPKNAIKSKEDERSEEMVRKTLRRKGDRIEVGLLWKHDNVVLPDSFSVAYKRLLLAERRTKLDPELKKFYEDTFADMLKKGYIRKLTREEQGHQGPRTFYIPHFPVINANKIPKKIRLVYDCAATANGVALNDALLKGPDDSIASLYQILLNFREGPYVVSGDIKEMFLQVCLRKEDQDSTRILWRDEDGNLTAYVFQRVMFGANCSPFLSQVAKNFNASEFANQYPEAYKAIVEHHYVDDFLMSFLTEESATKITNDVIKVHSKGGFEITKFISNSRKILQNLPKGRLAEQCLIKVDPKNCIDKVLGVFYDLNNDDIIFKLNYEKMNQDILQLKQKPTKRQVLSQVMQIFDPMQYVSHKTIHGRILIQKIFQAKIDWDKPIDDKLFKRFKRWLEIMRSIETVRFKRCYSDLITKTREAQLHVFVDASLEAYCCVAYLRFEHEGQIEVAFVTSKCRVASPKTITVPRLELVAALTGARVGSALKTAFQYINITNVHYWSDSQTVLGWLRSESRNYKIYVAHRVQEILELTKGSQWRHVPTHLNSADIGTKYRESDEMWYKGPPFLWEGKENWPSDQEVSSPFEELKTENLPSKKEKKDVEKFVGLVTKPKVIEANNYSTWRTLRFHVATYMRFIDWLAEKRPKVQKKEGFISFEYLKKADIWLIQKAQWEGFPSEMQRLFAKKSIETGPLAHLNCFLDENGLVRADSRLRYHNEYELNMRHPIVLPRKHKITELIVDHYHTSLYHIGHETLLSVVRHKYWIPQIRQAIKTCRDKCQYCKVNRAKPEPPMMGQIPQSRTTLIKAFAHTGMDLCGPFNVAVRRSREKRWIIVFTCMVTRAVHLDIVHDLTADSTLMAIRSLMCLRGEVTDTYSDNGTNFRGLERELGGKLAQLGIQQHFNPPAGSHFGGIWESVVKSVKRSLQIILKEQAPREDTLRAALNEIQRILNNRPLTHNSVEFEDDLPLTPADFLYIGQPAGDLKTTGTASRKQWMFAQQISQQFWRRWVQEYLPGLGKRSKWTKPVRQLEIGDIVYMADKENRNSWIKGIVTEVQKARDNQVRTCTIRTAYGTFVRPAVKLAKIDVGNRALENEEEHVEPSTSAKQPRTVRTFMNRRIRTQTGLSDEQTVPMPIILEPGEPFPVRSKRREVYRNTNVTDDETTEGDTSQSEDSHGIERAESPYCPDTPPRRSSMDQNMQGTELVQFNQGLERSKRNKPDDSDDETEYLDFLDPYKKRIKKRPIAVVRPVRQVVEIIILSLLFMALLAEGKANFKPINDTGVFLAHKRTVYAQVAVVQWTINTGRNWQKDSADIDRKMKTFVKYCGRIKKHQQLTGAYQTCLDHENYLREYAYNILRFMSNLDDTAEWEKVYRKPRSSGLIPGIWHFLFGQSETEEELTEFKIRQMQINSEIKRIINSTLQNVNVFDKNSDLRYYAIEGKIEEITYLLSEISIENLDLKTVDLSHQLINYLDSLKTRYTNLDDVFNLLSLEEINDGIHRIKMQLQDRTTLPPIKDLRKLLLVSEKSFSVENGTILLHVMLPAVYYAPFDEVNLIPIPNKETGEIIQLHHHSICINQQKQLYFLPTHEYIELSEEDIIMKNNKFFDTQKHEICETLLLKEHDKMDGRLCKKGNISHGTTVVQQLPKNNQYFYYTDKPEKTYISCKNIDLLYEVHLTSLSLTRDHKHGEISTGIAYLEPGCTLRFNDQLVMASNEIVTPISESKIAFIPLNITLFEATKAIDILRRLATKQNLSIDHIDTQSSIDALERTSEIMNSGHPLVYLNFVLLGVCGTITGIALVFLGYFLFQILTGRRQRKVFQQSINADLDQYFKEQYELMEMHPGPRNAPNDRRGAFVTFREPTALEPTTSATIVEMHTEEE